MAQRPHLTRKLITKWFLTWDVLENQIVFAPNGFLHKLLFMHSHILGFPGGSDDKESPCNAGDLGSIPGSGRSPGKRNGYPLQYSDLETMGSQRVGHDWVTFTFTLGLRQWLSGKECACDTGDAGSIPGWGRSPREGNGTLLQYSCLGNSMGGGIWQATVHRIAESDTAEETEHT